MRIQRQFCSVLLWLETAPSSIPFKGKKEVERIDAYEVHTARALCGGGKDTFILRLHLLYRWDLLSNDKE